MGVDFYVAHLIHHPMLKFSLDFSSMVYFFYSGNYKADVRYGGVAINGGPFVIKSFDLSKVRVVGIRDGIVGAKSTFTGDHFNSFATSISL